MNPDIEMSRPTQTVQAIAHPNIALVKYWGKRNVDFNLPAAGSISITLNDIRSHTSVSLQPDSNIDLFNINGKPGPLPSRMKGLLDHIRQQYSRSGSVQIQTHNNFPTAAGLASSASGYAALVTALNQLYELELDNPECSRLARLGSGSAARSIFGGFVEMNALDDANTFAKPLHDASFWPLKVVIATTSEQQKKHSSSDGMELSRQTSPYYENWLQSVEQHLPQARTAIANKDFEFLAEISEASCLNMHAVMISSLPGLIYWNAGTLNCIHAIRQLRACGTPVFFTIDAGPQVKAICLPEAADAVNKVLQSTEGVVKTFSVDLGRGAYLL